jgi:hypothetical protein
VREPALPENTNYELRVRVKGMDYNGREIAHSQRFLNEEHPDDTDTIELVSSYLKLINVPCIFDMGCE